MNNPRLTEIIADLVTGCSAETLDKLQQILLNNAQLSPYFFKELMDFKLVDPSTVVDLCRMLSSHEDNLAALFAIRAAGETAKRLDQKCPKVEVAWTGPWPSCGVPFRTSFNIYREMVDSAKKTVFATGYSVSESSSHASTLLARMAVAQLRGCKVTLLLHAVTTNVEAVQALWPPEIALPRILIWNSAFESGYLHAKLLLVDSFDVFITSANLSLHGMELNMETGIRVKGKPAEDMALHFDALERTGILRCLSN